MKSMQLKSAFVVPAVLLAARALAQSSGADVTPPTHASSVAADNSKSNQLDATNRAMTADRQKNDAADISLTKRIRESVIADKELSTYGHNIKIVAVNGTVTLNGVVHTAGEKAAIRDKANAVAGSGHVVDELKVAR